MYAFTISLWRVGVKKVDLVLHLMAQPPWDSKMQLGKGKPYYILHYTYGNDFDLTGRFTPGARAAGGAGGRAGRGEVAMAGWGEAQRRSQQRAGSRVVLRSTALSAAPHSILTQTLPLPPPPHPPPHPLRFAGCRA